MTIIRIHMQMEITPILNKARIWLTSHVGLWGTNQFPSRSFIMSDISSDFFFVIIKNFLFFIWFLLLFGRLFLINISWIFHTRMSRLICFIFFDIFIIDWSKFAKLYLNLFCYSMIFVVFICYKCTIKRFYCLKINCSSSFNYIV